MAEKPAVRGLRAIRAMTWGIFPAMIRLSR